MPSCVSKSRRATRGGWGRIRHRRPRILTAAHVVLDAQTVSVQGDGFDAVAEVVGVDKATDSAVIWTAAALPHHLSLSDATPALGSPLALLGFPRAVSDLRVTQGIVSGVDAAVENYTEPALSLEHLIATDAAINGGNSGGPALNTSGQVVGLVTGKSVWNVDDTPVEGTGYVVPSDQVSPS